jgi:GTP-binding protein
MDKSIDFNKSAANAYFELSAYEPSQISPSDKPEIVFSGKSNVGKSSMINRLINRKSLARVSSTPGKTVSINFYDCGFFRLVDLPGYGYAKVSKNDQKHWSALVDGYFRQQRNIALVIQLIDSRHEPSQGDLQMLDYLSQTGLKFIVALTKSDKLKSTQLAKRMVDVPKELSFCKAPFVFTSAENSMGMDVLKKEIIDACSGSNAAED